MSMISSCVQRNSVIEAGEMLQTSVVMRREIGLGSLAREADAESQSRIECGVSL